MIASRSVTAQQTSISGYFVRWQPRVVGLLLGIAAGLAYFTWPLKDDKSVTVDALVSDHSRREGWIEAIKEFQKAVMERSEDD
jgi:hypothetical protein